MEAHGYPIVKIQIFYLNYFANRMSGSQLSVKSTFMYLQYKQTKDCLPRHRSAVRKSAFVQLGILCLVGWKDLIRYVAPTMNRDYTIMAGIVSCLSLRNSSTDILLISFQWTRFFNWTMLRLRLPPRGIILHINSRQYHFEYFV